MRRNTLSTIEVARMLGVAVSSISKWIDEDKLIAGRTPGGHRRIEKDDFVRFLHQQNFRIPPELQSYTASILIVSDEKSFVKRLAEDIGHRYPQSEVSVAFDGYSAGEIVGLIKPTVIILDLQVQGMDGYEVCRRIKSNPQIRQAAIIALTAESSPKLVSKITALGACACFSKPLDIAALAVEIDKALGIVRPVRASAELRS